MRFNRACILSIALVPVSCAVAAETTAPVEERFIFEANSGETVEAWRGSLGVPENRSDPDSRKIRIHYVRFPATGDKKGPPIVYLAGGPGGSGIGAAKWRRFPLFMAMREFGDVIALDQRGTGASADAPVCRSSHFVPADRPVGEEEFVRLHRSAAAECAAFWKANGVDIHGYTTRESVADLDALRRHLGAEKIVLWGISYGSHLAFAALKDMGDRIDRVVISSAEGLDQTVKLPARTDAYFDRLQAALNADPAAARLMPDIKAMIRSVHARLDEAPVMLSIPQKDGDPAPLLLDKRAMQMIASYMISDPENAVQLLQIYLAASQENFDPAVQILQRVYVPGAPIVFHAMPLAMDMASGVSEARLAIIEEQAKTSLLGKMLNFPMPQVRGAIPGLDLGDDFRSGPQSDVPTLLLTGTLDGRTYVEGQAEAVAGLENLRQVMVVNAGHNLFMSSPEVTETILTFMRGEPVTTRKIIIAPPSLSSRD
ncbi:MAG: alpha/beta fold hydrolase [Amphiplicatus sp.]